MHATMMDVPLSLNHLLAKWQLPDRYEQLDMLPRTSTGKFYKLALRERFRR